MIYELLEPMKNYSGGRWLISTREFMIYQAWAVNEMRCQIGIRNFLARTDGTSEQFEQNEKCYTTARDIAIKLGAKVDNFPKYLRTKT